MALVKQMFASCIGYALPFRHVYIYFSFLPASLTSIFNIQLTLWKVIIFCSFYTSWYLLHPPSGINRAWGCKTEILLWQA